MKLPNMKKRSSIFRYSFIAVTSFVLLACGGGENADDPDPTVSEQPIAYVKRDTPVDNNNNVVQADATDPIAFRPGANLIVKSVATINATEINVTEALIGNTGDVRDPEFNSDGTKLIFSLRMEDDNTPPAETWDIYEYDLTQPLSQASGSENPRRVMFVDNAVQGHDIGPSYMAADRIIFSSTRAARTGSVLLAEGKGAFSPTIEATDSDDLALNLHSMASDGTDIKQLSFNMSHDLDPVTIRNIPGYEGWVLFTRWENSVGRNQMSLYVMKPDGSEVQHLYGAHSHDTGSNGSTIQFLQPRETSSGTVLFLAMPTTGTFDGGDPTIVEVDKYVDNTVPTQAYAGSTGPAQQSVSGGAVSTEANTISSGGRYSSVVPLLDGTNRALVSYSLCLVTVTDPGSGDTQTRICSDPLVDLTSPNTVEAAPRYGIYILDMGNNTILPITVAEPSTYYTDVAISHDVGTLQFIDDSFNLSTPTVGTLHIRSIYDTDGAYTSLGSSATSIAQLADPSRATGDSENNPTLIERPAMFLRLVKGAYLPDDDTRDYDNSAYGLNGSAQLMKEIIGYAPIEPDGSVKVNVPADVPISFSIVDKNGRRLTNAPRHGYWITVRPGETVTCHGCHNFASGSAHGRIAALAPSINSGADNTLTWPNTLNTMLVNVGETMAEARTNTQGAQSLEPSVDIVFDDPWTDPTSRAAGSGAADTAFTYSYNTVSTTHPLNRGACLTNWDETCRIIINYPDHIQPIWELARVDSNGVSRQCTSCHTTYDADNAQIQVPEGKYELDLTRNSPDAMGNSIDAQDANYFKSYIELFLDDEELVVQGNTLVDELFAQDEDGRDVLDENGNPIMVTHSVFGTNENTMILVAGEANSSTLFFQIFTREYFLNNPGDEPHWDAGANGGQGAPWLTTGELKLISEWIDIGAQYYNDPFVAPLD